VSYDIINLADGHVHATTVRQYLMPHYHCTADAVYRYVEIYVYVPWPDGSISSAGRRRADSSRLKTRSQRYRWILKELASLDNYQDFGLNGEGSINSCTPILLVITEKQVLEPKDAQDA